MVYEEEEKKKENQKGKEKTEEQLIEEAKKISVKEANAYSIMDGFGFRYVTPFALSIGANNRHIGLLSSIPSLIGNFSQLFTLKIMNKWSRKKITFWGVFLQAIMWLFIILVGSLYFVFGIRGEMPAYLLIAVYTLLILFGSFAGPAWSSWMKDLVSKNRGDYFGKRAEIAGIIAIICMIAAGFILDYFKNTKIFIGFFILFFLAFMGRSISAFLMKKQYEPKYKNDKNSYFSLKDFMKKMYKNNFGRFVLYFSLVSLTVTIASPFFAVFLLKDLGFSYVYYMIIILGSSIASLVSMPFWGRFADKYGTIKTMKICGPFIPLISLLWLFTTLLNLNGIGALIYLLIVESFSGIIFAGFNLSAGNFIYDAVTREKMAICSSYFSIINGFGVVIGSTLGGFISSIDFKFFGLTPILFVFLLSAIARFIVYKIMNNKIKEVRQVEQLKIKSVKDKFSYLYLKKILYFDYIPRYFKLGQIKA